MSGAITAFYKDLAARGHKDRVLRDDVLASSAGGPRRTAARAPTTARGAPMFLVGGKVKAGVVGKHPSLTELDDGQPEVTQTDFRQVYAAVLDQWLGVSSKDVLGGGVQARSMCSREQNG